MQMRNSDEELCWYVIHTKPKQEDRAAVNLNVWGIETFSPRFKDFRQRQPDTLAFSIKPLFPQYIFARFDIDSFLNRVSFTRGVHRIVRFGGTAVPIDDEMIAIMQLQAGEDGFIRIGEELKCGDQVIIKEGMFKNFIGIFDREIKDSDRVKILLTTISFQSHLVIERMLVKKICASVRAGKAQIEQSNLAVQSQR